jgi:hypothetical protein
MNDTFEELKAAIAHASTWKCQVICSSGYSIFESSKLQDIDLCQFISPVTKPATDSILDLSYLRSGSQFKFDPGKFKGVSSRQAIKDYIVNACQVSGFKVDPNIKLIKTTMKHKNKLPAKTCEIRFKCAHNRKSVTEMVMKKEDSSEGKLSGK